MRIVDTDRSARHLARLIAALLSGGRPDHDDPGETAITRLRDVLAAYGIPGKAEDSVR
jgi:hypothetical protein